MTEFSKRDKQLAYTRLLFVVLKIEQPCIKVECIYIEVSLINKSKYNCQLIPKLITMMNRSISRNIQPPADQDNKHKMPHN
jgi:hypothetical protein